MVKFFKYESINDNMNKLGNLFISTGIVLIFGLLFMRDKIWGEPNTTLEFNSIALCIIGLLFTFPLSIPCIIIGTILWQIFPRNKY